MIWYCNFTLGYGIQRRVLEHTKKKKPVVNQSSLESLMCSRVGIINSSISWMAASNQGLRTGRLPPFLLLTPLFNAPISHRTVANTSNSPRIFWDLGSAHYYRWGAQKCNPSSLERWFAPTNKMHVLVMINGSGDGFKESVCEISSPILAQWRWRTFCLWC